MCVWRTLWQRGPSIHWRPWRPGGHIGQRPQSDDPACCRTSETAGCDLVPRSPRPRLPNHKRKHTVHTLLCIASRVKTLSATRTHTYTHLRHPHRAPFLEIDLQQLFSPGEKNVKMWDKWETPPSAGYDAELRLWPRMQSLLHIWLQDKRRKKFYKTELIRHRRAWRDAKLHIWTTKSLLTINLFPVSTLS